MKAASIKDMGILRSMNDLLKLEIRHVDDRLYLLNVSAVRRRRMARPDHKSDERRARLGQALRANLLKRKAQAKAKEPAKSDGDEGRQS